MAEETFQSGICGGNWWNPTRGMLFGSSPCSSAVNEIGGFGWPGSGHHHLVDDDDDDDDMKGRSSSDQDHDSAGSVSDGSVLFHHDRHIHRPQQPCSATTGGGSGGGCTALMDSALQGMGINGISSPTTTTTTPNWSQTLLGGGGGEGNYINEAMVQEDMKSRRLNYQQQNGINSPPISSQKDNWKFGNNLSSMNQDHFSLDGFPLDSTNYPPTSMFLQSLIFDPNPQLLQQPLNHDNSININTTTSPSSPSPFSSNYELSSNFPKFSPLSNPSSHLHFNDDDNNNNNINNTPYSNATATALNDVIRASFLPTSRESQFLGSTFEAKPNCLNLAAKRNSEEVIRDCSSSVKKTSNEQAFKRARIETPSPLPTFKVRKEKLGDRITALQQLVSPFGKTDTASVLHEAIEYIKFLHDQVSVLSTPYMKNGAPNHPQQSTCEKVKNNEGPKVDLKSRGLCLVPLASTFPVANESANDLWMPTFGGTFR